MAAGPFKDVKEFQFKISGQLRVFSGKEKLDIDSPVKLVSISNKYGLVFIGVPSGLISIVSSSILNNHEIKNKPLVVTQDFPRRCFPLPSQPSHVEVNADGELIAVAIRIQNIPVLQIYSVASFGSQNVCKKVEMRMSNTGGVKVADMQWNPGIHNIISAVMSDGSVVLFEIKDSSFSLNSLPPATQAKCFCWSPKGKQLVIGSANGSLTQYKPDLKQVKNFPPPSPSASIVSVHWLSSFQFVAAYINTSVPHDRPAIVVVNVPKGAPVSYVKFDDVCFGSLSKRPEYYFIHQQVWNMLVVGCGDSMELSVLGLEPNSVNWIHWKQDDATRAELPLTEEKDDVHNLGIALDTSSTLPIQLNDSLSVGPMPIVISLSHDGVLCFFTALNLLPGVPSVCVAPQPLPDQSGLHLFVSPTPQQVVAQAPVNLQPTAPLSTFSQPSAASAPPISQTGSIFSMVSSTAQNIPPQASTIFSQSASSFTSSSFGQPASFSSSFPAAPQNTAAQTPSLFATTSPFSQSTTMFPKPTSVFQSLTPSVSQAAPVISQPSVPPVVSSVANTKPMPFTTPQTSAPVLTAPNIAAVSTASSPSFSLLAQQANQQAGLSKPPDNPQKFSFSFDGGKAESTPSIDKNQSNIEAKNTLPETATPAANTVTPDNKLTEEKADTTEIDNAAYTAAIRDELMSFQEEFTSVKQYLNGHKVKVAEEKVKGEICSKMDGYNAFSNELVDTTQAQFSEVHSLKLSVLDILSWIQLIKTKQYISKNQSLIEMREAEEMDPIGKHWCKRIEQQLYSLQFQVKRAVEQIESLKNSGKEGGSLYLPTFEAVLQILINQSKVVNVQKTTLTKLEDKLAEKVTRFQHRKKKIIQPDISIKNKLLNNESQLSMLAHKLLYTKLDSSDDNLYSYRETSQKMIVKGGKRRSLNPIKEQSLRQWYRNHKTIYSKITPRPSPLQSLNLITSPKPIAKSTDKKVVSFTNAQMEPSDSVMIKPVSSTPLGRPVSKSGQLNRNLFAASCDNSSSGIDVTPLNQDANQHVVYQEGLSSCPLPTSIKKDPAKINIPMPFLTSVSKVVPDTQVSVTTTSTPLTSPMASALSFSSVSTTLTSAGSKTNSTKLSESQPKSNDPVSKASIAVSQNPVFSFGVTTNKENTSLNSQIVPPSTSTSMFPKPTSKATLVFGGLAQSSETKSTVEEPSNTLSFNFNSMSSSLKVGTPAIGGEKPSSPPKIDSVPTVPIQSFSFGSSAKTVSEPVIPSVGATPVSSTPLFPFNSVTSNVSVPQSTAPVNSSTNPLTSFSFSSVSNAFKNPLTAVSTTTSINPVPSSLTMTVPTTSTAEVVTSAHISSVTITPAVTSSAPTVNETPTASAPGSSPSQTSVATLSVTPQVTTPTSKSSAPILFGSPAVTPTIATVAPAVTTTSTIFNSAQISFGSPPFKPPTTSAPAFGSSAFGSFAPAATSAPSIFGGGTLKFASNTTSTPPVFGQPVSTVAATPLFNQAATTSPPFGQTVTSTQTPSSPFNQTAPAQSTASSPFSQATTTFSTTTVSFGTSAFGSAPVFSSMSNTSFGGGSTFGAATTAPSVFGSPSTTTTASSLFNTPLFGQTTQAAVSPFGNISGQTSPFSTATPSTQAAASPFGATSPQANPFFNQSQPSVFGQSSSGGNFGSSGGSMFGSSSSFGSSPQGGGQFQSPGGNIFGGGNNSGPFSAGGGQTVGQAGFGAPPSFQSPKANTGAFGSAPVFGSTPSFGGAPTFGSSPTFGSPNKVFGSTSPVAPGVGFGGQNNMFENLANQNTMSFGNLAQTQPQGMPSTFGSQQQPQQSGSSFGGNAFSSWR